MAHRKTLWDRADKFAQVNLRGAARSIEKDKYALHEYLRYAFMKGFEAKTRDEQRKRCVE